MKVDRGLWTKCIAGSALLGSLLPLIGADASAGAEGGRGPKPAVRQIPGITAPDQHPAGCVDCHVYYPGLKLDARISTLMASWGEGGNSNLLSRMRALVPGGGKLKGRHPEVASALGDIPAACIACHDKSSNGAPSLGRMMHVIHLGGVKDGHFLSIFQGECTHCHKLEMSTGTWRMPSGPERPKASQHARGQAAIVADAAAPRTTAGEETFYPVVFAFFVILFTGGGVCVCLGMVALCQGDETSGNKA